MAGGPGFQVLLAFPQNGAGGPFLATEARALFASFSQSQRVGDDESRILTALLRPGSNIGTVQQGFPSTRRRLARSAAERL